ncbi:MAG: TAXI family TRAP transporter solute-binding subunit, partial [Burkholderiaceae bacterium]
GPMRLYNLFNNLGNNGQQVMVAGDAGIKTVADLKGKRVTWVKGSPALNTNVEAFLAFGGLTWDDVVKVEVPGWGQSAEAVINGQADATWGSTASSAYNKVAASPRGIFWISLPHSDEAAWKRSQKINPIWIPTMVETGVKIEQNASGKVPYEGNNFPYPMFVANNTLSDEVAYGLTKAVLSNYEQIKDSGPSMLGYQVSKQVLNFVYPYHPGSIKYFKEAGIWKPEHDKHNAMLLKRQDVLAAAWKKMDMNMPDDAFEAAWQRVRGSALKEAGLEVIFERW